MLKMTGITLGKIVDIDMYLFTEKWLRGGISYIAKRYCEADNKYKNDPKNPLKYISYLDMNNLYGWVMSGYLSYGGFKWLKNLDGFDVNSISEKIPIGYILEFDIEYPDELSGYCKNRADEYEIKVGDVEQINSKFGSQN